MKEPKGYQIMFGIEVVNTIQETDINAFIDHIQLSKYVPIISHNNYEIATTYSCTILMIKNQSKWVICPGYIKLQLNKKSYQILIIIISSSTSIRTEVIISLCIFDIFFFRKQFKQNINQRNKIRIFS